MKKIKIRFMAAVLAVVLVIRIVYMPLPVYANEYVDGLEEILYDLFVWVGTHFDFYISFNSGDFEQALENVYLLTDKINSGLTFEEWLQKNYKKSDNGEIEVSEELIKFLQEFADYYAQQHPDEVEKINCRIIHTLSYEEAFSKYIAYGNVFDRPLNLPDGCNSLDYWYDMWKTRQTDYDVFPRLITFTAYSRMNRPENVQDLTVAQDFSFFEGYEQGRTMCMIGGFGGQSAGWGTEEQYRIGIYTYDAPTGALSVDRMTNGFTQSCRFIWDESEEVWNATENYHGCFSSGSYAYINMTAGWWANSWGYFARNPDPAYAKRYNAVYNDDGTITIPVLATPNGSSFRLFATEQDALRYFETCANSGLNFDPNQIYTGGSVTINNNGDVTINNTPPDDEDIPPINSSEISGMIYNRLGEILTQVAQIKQFSAADAVINAFDAYEGGINGIADELVDSISQVFPFCILWDFVRIVKIFEAEPISPVFEIPIKFVWIDETITIDLTEYETIFALLRTGEIILFLLGLFNITMAWVGKGDEVI